MALVPRRTLSKAPLSDLDEGAHYSRAKTGKIKVTSEKAPGMPKGKGGYVDEAAISSWLDTPDGQAYVSKVRGGSAPAAAPEAMPEAAAPAAEPKSRKPRKPKAPKSAPVAEPEPAPANLATVGPSNLATQGSRSMAAISKEELDAHHDVIGNAHSYHPEDVHASLDALEDHHASALESMPPGNTNPIWSAIASHHNQALEGIQRFREIHGSNPRAQGAADLGQMAVEGTANAAYGAYDAVKRGAGKMGDRLANHLDAAGQTAGSVADMAHGAYSSARNQIDQVGRTAERAGALAGHYARNPGDFAIDGVAAGASAMYDAGAAARGAVANRANSVREQMQMPARAEGAGAFSDMRDIASADWARTHAAATTAAQQFGETVDRVRNDPRAQAAYGAARRGLGALRDRAVQDIGRVQAGLNSGPGQKIRGGLGRMIFGKSANGALYRLNDSYYQPAIADGRMVLVRCY